MSRRIDIELTSDRGDGTWTWRAAGASKPRGVVEATLVPAGAEVGDVLRAETETDIEGVTITSLGSTQTRARTEPERIEIIGSGRRDDEQLVTTQLAPKGRGGGGDRDRRDRRPRGDRPEGDRDRRPRREGDRREGGGDRRPRGEGERPGGDRRPRSDRPGGDRERGGERRGPRRPAPPALPERPKPKRLRPGRAHRKAVLTELPAEQQPIAEEVLRGGIPAVRQAIDAENEKRKANGEPPVGDELLELAESLLPRLRAAEWRDRAEAALADADELDLRDLRTVVVAADSAARDDEARELAAQLRTKLDERVVAEQALWLEDLQLALDAGRIVRALRVSSRPPKAGTMLSPELRLALLGGANAALSEEATPDRWAAVLDAIAYSPVAKEVAPVSMPSAPSDELLSVIRKYASRVPKVAIAFGVEPTPAARPRGRALRPPKPSKPAGAVPVPKRPDRAGLAAPVPTAATRADRPAGDAESAPTTEAQGPDEVAAEVPSPVAPERAHDTLPGPADGQVPDEVPAADPYGGSVAPEAAESAVEEAVESASDEEHPDPEG
jgi:hypothetical protein